MKSSTKVSCLIPFYNEGERVFDVLDVVTKVQQIDKIICIDDGSEDTAYRDIQKKYPDVEVLRLAQNGGKTAAIKAGLENVDTDFVLLMDADLQNVDRRELVKAIRAVQRYPFVDMVILRRVYADWFVKFNRGDILLSGERIIRTSDLRAVLEQPVEGFQLEMAINEYMQEQSKMVRWFPWSATNTYKMEKRGPVEGFIHDFKMYAHILQYVGPVGFVKQVVTFGRRPMRLPSK
ncbi:glycosyltransferase [Nibrella saemangeumensis]|uniref:Glycosyltransferase n=1 Tax=Nibrella saemangeumensis TaxID=1084526 RepID=A0ABP8NNF7_9BACT